MGDVPVQINPVATFVDGLVAALIKGGAELAKDYIKVEAPFLALPIISFFVNQIINYLANAIAKWIANAAVYMVIDIQTNGEKSAVQTAAVALQFALSSGDPVAIKKAQDELSNAYGQLIHWDGIVE